MISDILKAIELAKYEVKPNGIIYYGACCLGWKKPKDKFSFDSLGFFRPDSNSRMLRQWAGDVGISYRTELRSDGTIALNYSAMLGTRMSIDERTVTYDNPPTRFIFKCLVDSLSAVPQH